MTFTNVEKGCVEQSDPQRKGDKIK